MEKFSIKDVGVKVGLEIHQQLETNKKLFCNCTPIESEDYSIKFQRKLRASKSELGEFDPAALFESTKSKTIMYYANEESSCLVEQDEEPPHELDEDARRIALIIAVVLGFSQISKAQTDCQGSLTVNVGSIPDKISIFHSGFYFAFPEEQNNIVWEVTNSLGEVIVLDTIVGDQHFTFNHLFTQTLHCTEFNKQTKIIQI